MGETPNIAARLQSLATPNAVVIGPGTHELAAGRFEYTDLGVQPLKGIVEPVHAWRVIAPSAAESRFDATHRAGITPLVGRKHEIGLLLERWEHAKDGDGQVVCLSGEPGIGKSRISEILRDRTIQDNPIRLRYQCSDYHTNSALHPIIEQLERAAGFENDDSADDRLKKLETLTSQGTQNVEAVVPLFASLLSISIEDRYAPLEMSPDRQKADLLEALVSQLEGLSHRQPVLLLFEDVHWADPTSLELLGLIVVLSQSFPLLAVITFRPGFSPPWGGHSHVTSLILNRFSRSMATTMIEKVADEKRLPEKICDQIIEKTDGVPLFVEELTKIVIESELLIDRGDHYELSGPLPDLVIPSTLQDSLMARLDGLTASARELAQIASVIGRDFYYDLLKTVSPLSENRFKDALDELIGATLVFRQGVATEGNYVFKHALVRDAAYESLLKNKRRGLHARLADALVEDFSEMVNTEPEVLAHHYTEAGLTEAALDYWLRAGRNAAVHGAYVEAISHLRRGLALLEKLPKNPERIQAEIAYRVALGVPLVTVEGGASPEVAVNYDRARDLCEEAGEHTQIFSVLWGLWFHHLYQWDLRRACGLADQLLEIVEDQDDEALRLEAHHCQWATRFLTGDLAAALDHSQLGIKHYRSGDHQALAFTFGGHDPGVCALANRAVVLWLSGYPDRARKRLEEANHLAQKFGHSGTLGNELSFAVTLSMLERDRDAVERQAAALHLLSPEDQTVDRKTQMDGARGWAMFERGEYDSGLMLMRGSARSWLGRSPMGMGLIPLVATALGHHGDAGEGIELIDEALRCGQRDDVHWCEAELHRVKGELQRASNETIGAEHCFQQAIDVAQNQGAKSLELRAAINLTQLWTSQGKQRAARELLTPIHDWFTEGFDTPDLKEARSLLEQLR